MAVLNQASAYRLANFGAKIDRATGNIAQTGDLTLFTVAGGKVIVTSIVGVVTTIIQAQANAVKLKSVPTTGTAKDISATFDVNALEVGGLLTLDGTTLGTALSGTNAGAALMTKDGVIIPVGSIKMNAAASSTGQIQWSLTYIPYDDGATVVAA